MDCHECSQHLTFVYGLLHHLKKLTHKDRIKSRTWNALMSDFEEIYARANDAIATLDKTQKKMAEGLRGGE